MPNQGVDIDLKVHLDELTFHDNIILGLITSLKEMQMFREGTKSYEEALQHALHHEKVFYQELKQRFATDNVRRN